MLKYLKQQEAINVDQELFNDYRFDVMQLMELAGLSCAHSIAQCFPAGRVLLLCGPGNNGGDGLVCARHLSLMGFRPTVICSKPPEKTIFQNLVHQCTSSNVPVVYDVPKVEQVDAEYAIIVDALFGFSFRPPVRPAFDGLMQILHDTKLPVARYCLDLGSNVCGIGVDPFFVQHRYSKWLACGEWTRSRSRKHFPARSTYQSHCAETVRPSLLRQSSLFGWAIRTSCAGDKIRIEFAPISGHRDMHENPIIKYIPSIDILLPHLHFISRIKG